MGWKVTSDKPPQSDRSWTWKFIAWFVIGLVALPFIVQIAVAVWLWRCGPNYFGVMVARAGAIIIPTYLVIYELGFLPVGDDWTLSDDLHVMQGDNFVANFLSLSPLLIIIPTGIGMWLWRIGPNYVSAIVARAGAIIIPLYVLIFELSFLPVADYYDGVFSDEMHDTLVANFWFYLLWSLPVLGIASVLYWLLNSAGIASFVVAVSRLRRSGSDHNTEAKLKRQKYTFLFITLLLPFAAEILRVGESFLETPAAQQLRIARLPFVTVETLQDSFYVGGAPLPADYRAVMQTQQGTYFLLTDNVLFVNLKHERKLLFGQPLADLSDFVAIGYDAERPDTVVVVTRSAIGVANGSGGIQPLTTLPGTGFHLGLQALPDVKGIGAFLAFGMVGDRGHVFLLTPTGEIIHLVEADGFISSAAACGNRTVVAEQGAIVMLAPGDDPKVLSQLPEDVGPIRSILPYITREFGGADDCGYLVSTDDAVFGVSDGFLSMLVGGLSGVLRNDPTPGASTWIYLADAKRNVAAKLLIGKL